MRAPGHTPSTRSGWPGRGLTRRGLGQRGAALAGGALAPLALLVGACAAPGGPGDSGGAGAPAVGRVGGELRFLHWIPDWVQKLEPAFQAYKERTGTQITVELVDAGQYATKITAAFVAEAAPDVLFGYSFVDTKHYDSGYHLDLTDRWRRDRFDLGDYALMGIERWCGKAYGMPFFAEPFVMYYNKTLLRQNGIPDPWEAPLRGDWTWDDLVEMSRRVSRPARGDEPAGVYGLYWPYDNVTYFGPNVWSFGGDHTDFERMRWALDSPVALEAFQRYGRWVQDRLAIGIGSPDWQAIAQAYPGKNPFHAGRAAFWYRSVTEIGWNQQRIGADFEWDLLPVPRQGNRPGVSMNAGHVHHVWSRSKVADQGWEFMRYLASPDVQEIVGRSRISLPGLKSKFDVFLSPPPVPHAHVAADVYKKPRGIHFRHHDTPTNWDQYRDAILPLMRGEGAMPEGLRELNRQMNDKVQYGTCAPYKGITHPLPPGV